MGRNKVHSNEPLGKWCFGVLKDCSYKAGEILVAMSAMVSAVLGCLAVMFATIWANDVSVSPSTFDNSLFADVFGIEVSGKRNKAVELCKIYHICNVVLTLQNVRNLFEKSSL